MFHLLRYFSLTSLCAFALTTVFLGSFYRQKATADLVQLEESKNVALTQAFANSLGQEFDPFLSSTGEFTDRELRNHPQTNQLRRAVLQQMQGLSVVKVKVFDLHGRTIFSTDSRQIGSITTSKGYAIARSGRAISVLNHRENLNPQTNRSESRSILSSYIPLWENLSSQKLKGVFELYSDVTPSVQRLEETQRTIFVAVAILLSSLYLILFLIVRRADRILKKQHDDLLQSESQAKRQASELQNTLEKLQKTQMQLVHSEKMSSLGQMVAGVAHEINNPVNFIHGNLAPARQYTQDLLDIVRHYQQYYPNPPADIQTAIDEIDLDFLAQDLPKLLASMQTGTDRIREIVKSLRTFSRLDEAEIKQVDLHANLDSTLTILQHRLKAKPGCFGIEVLKEYEQLPPVHCYPGQLNQVFMNVLSNAIDAIEESFGLPLSSLKQDRGQIRIRTESLHNQWVAIYIADNGPGISPAVQSRLFDPFFTTKPVGRGTGLGLSISYQIVVELHGGQIECHSSPKQGTEFSIKLPINPESDRKTIAVLNLAERSLTAQAS